MASISQKAFSLIIAEGQLECCLQEERRWRLREQEAHEMLLKASADTARWKATMQGLQRSIGAVSMYETVQCLNEALSP